MINSAHPRHFAGVLEDAGPWLDRIRGIRANASTTSHAELDEAEKLDDGDPAELGADYRPLKRGCRRRTCSEAAAADHRHVGEVCATWFR